MKTLEEQEEDRKAGGRNIKRLQIHNWRGKIQDLKPWKTITKEAKTSKALE